MSTPNLPFDIRAADTPKDLSLWYANKKAIKNLYIHQNRNLRDVKTVMEREHGFPTTMKLSEYEQVVRDVFKFRKNLSADDWSLSIGPEIARRKAAGKRSAVLLNGAKVEHVDRKIQRSLRSKRLRRCAQDNSTAMPCGVVIRTPSPQPSALASSLPFGKDPDTSDLGQNTWVPLSMEFLEDYKAELPWVSSLMDIPSLLGSRPNVEVLSVHLLRQNSPINKFLILLNEYQRKSNLADLRLFGPNATVSILGKICFDFSNNLQRGRVSPREITSILDWIGFRADIASLKTFFAQQRFTILAVWEGIQSTFLSHRHPPALNVFLTVHLSIRNKAPWDLGDTVSLYPYMDLAPDDLATFINAFPHTQWELDKALQIILIDRGPIMLVKSLVIAGASLKNSGFHHDVDYIIHHFAWEGCTEADIALLKGFLEAGAPIDYPNEYTCHCRLGWKCPGCPIYVTDYLILNGAHHETNHGLLSLVSSYSNRQQIAITVPGIFEAAQHGQEQLRLYLNARLEPDNDYDRKRILEVALSEAAGRGHANVLQSLVQFGVDPNVRLLLSKDAHPPYCKYMDCSRDYQMLKKNWHPVIRAANGGELDTLRTLVTGSYLDLDLLDEELCSCLGLDLCALRKMEDSQLNQILELLSTLHLDVSTGDKLLLDALKHRGCCVEHFESPNFPYEFVDRLVRSVLTSLDCGASLCGRNTHTLVRFIRGGCGIRALTYLVEKDSRLLSTPDIKMLLEATLQCGQDFKQGRAVLEFLSRKLEAFDSYVQENSSTLLSTFLRNPRYDSCGKHYKTNCEIMITAQWLLGLGATLEFFGFTELIRHANESFMLDIIDSVRDIELADKSCAVQKAIETGRFTLAKVLIEKGVQINDPLTDCEGTVLQFACIIGAPLWFVRFLIDKGADVNAPPGTYCQCTALQLAVLYGSMNMAGLLLDCGADVNGLGELSDSDGYEYPVRAIDLAAEMSSLDMVHFLIAAGARSGHPGLTGFDGAITTAICFEHLAIVALLRKHADCCRGDRMEAEMMLQANPDAPMHKGKKKAQAGSFTGRQGGDSEADLDFDWEDDIAHWADQWKARRVPKGTYLTGRKWMACFHWLV